MTTPGTGAERPGNPASPSRRTLVIIPTYNERENLPLIVGRVHAARPDVHVLIVDDGSPDGTGRKVMAAQAGGSLSAAQSGPAASTKAPATPAATASREGTLRMARLFPS